MPNWCENRLIIQGRTERIEEFRQKARGEDTDLSLDKMHPMPKELEDTVAPGDNLNGYDWRVDNWGTKGDVEATLTYESEGLLEYDFLSAWAPPIVWLEMVAKAYPDLEFWLKYEEEGIGFMGIAKAKKGEVEDLCLDTT